MRVRTDECGQGSRPLGARCQLGPVGTPHRKPLLLVSSSPARPPLPPKARESANCLSLPLSGPWLDQHHGRCHPRGGRGFRPRTVPCRLQKPAHLPLPRQEGKFRRAECLRAGMVQAATTPGQVPGWAGLEVSAGTVSGNSAVLTQHVRPSTGARHAAP